MALLSSPAVQDSKAKWRVWAREARAAVPDASAPLCTSLATFLHEQGVRRVLAYRALPGEPDVSTLANQFELLTSRARFRPEPHLTLHPWASATEFSRFGALQPPADAPREALSTVDAALLPGLAFDERGVRLGYGGGFTTACCPASEVWWWGWCGRPFWCRSCRLTRMTSWRAFWPPKPVSGPQDRSPQGARYAAAHGHRRALHPAGPRHRRARPGVY
ncbi:5-formyltetrahydrofolate cyclo-ligase [Deinococcus malanensis]|uniref:5-formyltetrahydrofolate cyclo-ligase n=1 Tax=Deinococcus malanensis TaxID=1706855 RepID=UPI0036253871